MTVDGGIVIHSPGVSIRGGGGRLHIDHETDVDD